MLEIPDWIVMHVGKLYLEREALIQQVQALQPNITPAAQDDPGGNNG